MSHELLADVFVMLCDWRGRCAWTSGGGDLPIEVGGFIWEHLSPESCLQAKLALGQVVALREGQLLEVIRINGDRFRDWFLPLDSPEMAVFVLGTRIPNNLGLLTERERVVLSWLGQGLEPRVIAEKLDISVSTIHTHLKHSREKLELPCLEALICFAARYCHPIDHALNMHFLQQS